MLLLVALAWESRLTLVLTNSLVKSKVGILFGPFSSLKMKRGKKLKVLKSQKDQYQEKFSLLMLVKLLSR